VQGLIEVRVPWHRGEHLVSHAFPAISIVVVGGLCCARGLVGLGICLVQIRMSLWFVWFWRFVW